jgi:hypothetical protein
MRYLTLWTEPIALRLGGQFEALGVVHPGAELTAEHLTLAVAQPAVEVVPAVLRGRVHGVRVERRLLGVIEGAVSQL